jgi:hypothetical protein
MLVNYIVEEGGGSRAGSQLPARRGFAGRELEELGILRNSGKGFRRTRTEGSVDSNILIQRYLGSGTKFNSFSLSPSPY